jgi:hypothetical protein
LAILILTLLSPRCKSIAFDYKIRSIRKMLPEFSVKGAMLILRHKWSLGSRSQAAVGEGQWGIRKAMEGGETAYKAQDRLDGTRGRVEGQGWI